MVNMTTKFRTFDGKRYMGFKGKQSKAEIKKAHRKGILVRNIRHKDGWHNYIHKKR